VLACVAGLRHQATYFRHARDRAEADRGAIASLVVAAGR